MTSHRMISVLGLALGLIGLTSAVPAAQVLPRQEIMDQVGRMMQRELDLQGQGMRVASVYYANDLRVGDGRVEMVLDGAPTGLPPGRHTLNLMVNLEGQTQFPIQVVVNLRQVVRVPVLTRTVSRGEEVTMGDLEWREQEMVAAIGDLVATDADVMGKVANRTIRAGLPLRADWLEVPVVVERGDRLRVVLNSHGLSIETSAVALAQGRVGETIQVRNLRTSRLFMARVAAAGEVVVER